MLHPDLPRPDAADVATARHKLTSARSRLDSAVANLPDIDGDDAMATPELLLLLVDAVRAKERLDLLQDAVENRR
jgi:hypothetical protein